MNGRDLRIGDIKALRAERYREIVSDAYVARWWGARGPSAVTALAHEAKDAAKPCKIFRGPGDICTRPRCGHDRAVHAFVRRQRVQARRAAA